MSPVRLIVWLAHLVACWTAAIELREREPYLFVLYVLTALKSLLERFQQRPR
jgi:hypothetical protein